MVREKQRFLSSLPRYTGILGASVQVSAVSSQAQGLPSAFVSKNCPFSSHHLCLEVKLGNAGGEGISMEVVTRGG